MSAPVAIEHVVLAAAAPFVGSFLGVILDRLPHGRSPFWGRSSCDNCGVTLAPRDLIPVISWLLSRGRCRSCDQALGWHLPGMELGALAIALWAASEVEGWLFWISCGLGWLLLALAAIDWRHMVLPDSLTLPLIPTGLAVAFALDRAQSLQHLFGAGLGFVTFLALRMAYQRIRGREGLGLGDVKLMAGAGAWVSWWGVPSVILFSGATALAAALTGRLLGRPLGADTAIPFGSFLCLGIWLVWLYGPLVLA